MERDVNGEILEEGETCLVCGHPVKTAISGDSIEGVGIITECNC